MKKILALALLSLIAFAQGISTQTQAITSPASEVEKLVEVESDFSLEKLVPGSEYKANAAIKFAIPAESLKNFNEEKISVHVRAAGAREDSWVYFRGVDGGSKSRFKQVFFSLECVVAGGACDGQKSVLEKKIPVFYSAPGNVQGEQRDDGFVVEASLKPFAQQTSLAEAVEELNKLRENFQAIAFDDELLAITQQASDAVQKALEAGWDDGTALAKVREAALAVKQVIEAPSPQPADTASEAAAEGLSLGRAIPFTGLITGAKNNWLGGAALLAVVAIALWLRRKTKANTQAL